MSPGSGFGRQVPNLITLLRLALVPVIALLLWQRHDDAALALFLVCALSDFVDGVLARRWRVRTRFGAVTDPIADKSCMLAVALILTLQGSLPWWFALALILRDLIIVGGVIAWHRLLGRIEMAPSAISKLNTALQFLALLAVLTVRAGRLPAGAWVDTLLLAAMTTIVLSGLHYIVVWGGKAATAVCARRGRGA